MSHYYTQSYPYRHTYRFPYRKSYGFIVFAIIILIMSWEAGKMDAAIVSADIPQEAIRLRILANSDSPSDQLVKRLVRDEVVKAMASWATGPQTIEEARATIRSHMDELNAIAGNVLASRGFGYTSTIQLGNVDFPTKIYGNKVYPAGEYEALLITIGDGAGQNWWCVLFPPLCFMDATTGEASAASADAASPDADGSSAKTAQGKAEVKEQTSKSDAKPVIKPLSDESGAKAQKQDVGETPDVKFFLWEMIKKLIAWIVSLFS
ncbi:stage II sporulation protein R [Paenibacillus sp. HB172176]|uniref:stage II sporulation protein R n=1 Tax=Paenibacillus sp. HB172176 TaxID=2493690 RepID=UPI00143CBEC3|nr:stage II sporulation protein R [Paenibacillus sp. HB172176]